jgi:ABC-2 type transport system permease protein
MLSTPNRSALLVGYGAVALIRAVITFGVVTIVAVIAGMNILGTPVEMAGFYGLAAIVNVAGLLFAAGIALRFRSLQATPLMQVPVFLFLFLAPVYVPRELLGGWVHSVSGFDPATHIMETGRDLVAGQPSEFLAALAIAVGMAALLLVFAIRGLRSAEAAG